MVCLQDINMTADLHILKYHSSWQFLTQALVHYKRKTTTENIVLAMGYYKVRRQRLFMTLEK